MRRPQRSIDDALADMGRFGVMHLLEVEGGSIGAAVVRGLVSRAQIERRLDAAAHCGVS